MAFLVFNEVGERRIPEISEAECEAIEVYNWMERARSTIEKTSIKSELAGVTAVMGKVSDVIEVERAILRVHFGKDVCVDRLSLGIKYIAAKLTSETQADIQGFRSTYDSCKEYRQPQLQTSRKNWDSL